MVEATFQMWFQCSHADVYMSITHTKGFSYVLGFTDNFYDSALKTRDMSQVECED